MIYLDRKGGANKRAEPTPHIAEISGKRKRWLASFMRVQKGPIKSNA